MKPKTTYRPLLSSMVLVSVLALGNAPAVAATDAKPDGPVIQVALLLDTSSSMDGLIDQAKSRLWSVVNSTTKLRYRGQAPRIEIALYEYGNDNLSPKKNWIRQVTPLTQDLDMISENLFALRTQGGSEYAGAVIKDATDTLAWKQGPQAMKIIYIAGNESFAQGGVSYREAIADARSNNIHLNTIYCGDHRQGITLEWKAGADLAQGRYMAIDSNQKSKVIETPFDAELAQLNTQLNGTYYGYGREGASRKAMQAKQDSNASSKSMGVLADRSLSKSNANLYRNGTWDVIDRAQEDSRFLAEASEADLPEELRGKTLEQKQQFVGSKQAEREGLRKQMSKLAKQREAFIQQKSQEVKGEDDLGQAIEQSVMTLAKKNGFSTE